MTDVPTRPRPYTHGLRTMIGRDPSDKHRAATPLELLYDLVFVISFGVAASELAHAIAEGWWSDGLFAFGFTMFAVIWTWINFSWFASAFDTDDWAYRLLVMVQMIGVVILALGIPEMFASVHSGGSFKNTAGIIGYVVMRIPMIILWLRVAKSDPENAKNAYMYAATLTIAQVGWCLTLLLDVSVTTYILVSIPLFLIELLGPYRAEHTNGGTPWHPHHIAERYGLMAIIAFGEILIGTVSALEAVIEADGGWTVKVAVLAVFGVALTFGLWWLYFMVPSAEGLSVFRGRAFVWGYGHIIIYASIAAVGAGLDVGALYLEHEAVVGRTAVIASIAIPMAIYLLATTLISTYLTEWAGPILWTLIVKVALLGTAIGVVAAGADFIWGVGILILVPVLSIVIQETIAGDAQDEHLDSLVEMAEPSH